MRRTIWVTGLILGLLSLNGCNTPTKTFAERVNTYNEVMESDFEQLADDWDLIWLADRQYRLSRWHVR
ncbi:MAG: hypothetical protein U1D55_18000 [Phycisphaerae bacterium]